MGPDDYINDDYVIFISLLVPVNSLETRVMTCADKSCMEFPSGFYLLFLLLFATVSFCKDVLTEDFCSVFLFIYFETE